MGSTLDELQSQLGLGIWTFLTICPIMYYWFPFYLILASKFSSAFHVRKTYLRSDIPEKKDGAWDTCNYLANGTEVQPCTEWDFDHSTFKETLTSEFSLVCSRENLRATYQSLLMLGAVAGASFCGFLADRFGRKPCIQIGYILYSIVCIVPFWSHNFQFILVARFLAGVCYPSILMTGYVLAMEMVVPQQRTVWGLVLFLPWCVGTSMWGLLGYLIREWRYLQLASTLPYIILIPALWWMNESPRWLLVNGHTERARVVLGKAARWNKLKLTDQQIEKYIQEAQEELNTSRYLDPKTKVQNGIISYIKTTSQDLIKSVIILFGSPKIRVITLASFLSMFVTSMVFFGLSLNAVNFGMDAFTYMALTGLMELPGYTLTIPIAARLGRKLPIIICFLASGASLLTLPFIPEEITWLKIILAMMGKLAISAAFTILYLYVIELFPTDVRMRGAGLAMLLSRIGSVCSPYVTDVLEYVYQYICEKLFFNTIIQLVLLNMPPDKSLGVLKYEAALKLQAYRQYIHNSKDKNDPAELKNLDLQT
ncbi:unnamed protein product, partial [Meganyctiphanes norvegica]